MSLNNKPTYGTVPADSGATKGSRRNLVVGLVRPRARKSIHGAFMSTESSHRARRHRRDVCFSQAAAACFALGVAAANVVPTQGLRGTALYTKDESINYDNAGKKNNIVMGNVPPGSVIGLGPAVKPAPAVKPVPGVPGVPGVGGDGNVSPPTPPATPATPTPATPAASNCCQVFGSCPAGYKPSGNVNANSACCKDWSLGISINSGMPTCPTTSANDPFPNPDWTMGDPIGPITPTTENLGPIVQTGDKPITIGGPKIGAIKTPDTQTNLGPIQTGNPNGMFDGESVFGQSGSPFGPNGFDGGMGMGMGMGGPIKTPSYKNNGY